MDLIRSQYQPILTLDYMKTEPENKIFDRKSARIKPSDLAETISGFANADGGTVVIGINDKTRELEGIKIIGDKIGDLMSAHKDHCAPMPQCTIEKLDITNAQGQPDALLLIPMEYF